MDIGLLADPTRCPDCALVLTDAPSACHACGLPLRGPLVDQLWRVSLAAARMLDDRSALIAALRGAPVPARVDAGASTWSAVPGPSPRIGLAGPVDPPPPWVPSPRSPRRPDAPAEPVAPHSVQRLLLGLGVLLLAVAALIFTVVAWGRIGIGGRSAILAGVTAAAACGSVVARRRDLPGTAEALAALTVAFLLLDAAGARSAGLAGLDGTDADTYWAGVLALLAALGAGLWRAHPLGTVRWTAVLAAQLPVPVLGDRLEPHALAGLLISQGTVAVLLARRATGQGPRVLLGLGGGIAYVAGVLSAVTLAYGMRDDPAPGTDPRLLPAVLLLVLGSVAAAAIAWDGRTVEGLRRLATGAATACALFALHAPLYRHLEHDASTAAGAAVLLAAAAVLSLAPIPTAWRLAPLAVVTMGATAAFLDVAAMLGAVLGGPLGWLDDPWSRDAGGSAQELLGEPWIGTGADALTLALLTAGACLVAWRLRRTLAVTIAGAVGTATALVLPIALDVPYLVAVLAYVSTGGALIALASRLHGSPGLAGGFDADTSRLEAESRATAAAAGLATAGGLAVALGLAWSLAARPATPWALLAGLVAAGAAYAVSRRPAAPAPLVAATLLLVAETFVLARTAGAGPDRAGFAAVVAAGALAVLAGYLPRAAERGPTQLGAALAATAAFLPVTSDAGWSSHALLAAGTAAALVAIRPDRREAGPLAGALLTAGSWVRLAEAHVSTPEAYTTGPALALLAAGWWSARHAAEGSGRSSWASYGSGLTLGLLPSLAAVLAGDGDDLKRPLLLGLVSLVVLLVGARTRLRAPLVVGAFVLGLDTLTQIGPYVAALPRWVSIGGAGVLLLALGATFERRLRDLRRLRDRLDALA
jgi:hypothetical protein